MASDNKHSQEKERLTDRDHVDKERANTHAMNTSDNAIKALAAARECIRFLTAGRIWAKTTPEGKFEITGSLMLEDATILALHFSSEDGSVLPEGLHDLSQVKPEVPGIVESLLNTIARDLEVLDGADFCESESCWVVPVAYRNRIVAHIKVSGDGGDVLTDNKAF